MQVGSESRPQVFVESGVFGEILDCLAHELLELWIAQRAARNPDHGKGSRQPAVVSQAIERWHQLTFGEVAGGAEDDHRALRSLALKSQRVGERVRAVGHVLKLPAFEGSALGPKAALPARGEPKKFWLTGESFLRW